MIKNKKGFSLVELLAVIVILGILSTSAIIGVSYVINNAKREKIKRQESALAMAAQAYYQANKEYLPKNIGEVEEVYAYTLYDKKFLKKEIENEKGEKCMNNSYVSVHKTSKGDYKYKAYLYCGSDTRVDDEKGKPTISILFTDEDGNIDAFQNVSKAKLVIKITGGVDPKTSKEIPIEGYSFSIATKAGANPYMDDYNSGSLSGNNKTEITINKALREFIDITKANDVRVTVNVTNVDGGVNTFTRSTDESYSDSTKPFCSKIIQQAKSSDKWINANDYYNNNKKRKTTVLCDDGYGSGCVRGEFTRTWPNKYQKDAEYGYIQVSDNAGNSNLEDSFVNSNNLCSETFKKDGCRVLVKVDTTYPKITIDAYKRGSDGKKSGNSVFSSAAVKTLGGTSTYTQPTHTILSSQYTNLVNDWMNKEKFGNGVIYKVTISDNLHLASWKWETNKANLISTSTDYNKYGQGSESTSGEIDDSLIDMTKNNCGHTTTKDFYIHFIDEGARKGRLTVKDKAGNATIYYIEALIDRTPPSKPKVTNPKNDTWTRYEVTVKLESKDNSNGSGIGKYQYGSWHDFADSDKTSFSYEYKNDTNSEILYRACDKAGNCSDSTSTKLKIDKTPPTCGRIDNAYPVSDFDAWGNWRRGTFNIYQYCNDSGSGCTKNPYVQEYKRDLHWATASDGQIYFDQFYNPSDAWNDFKVIYDNAGNIQVCNFGARADNCPPETPYMSYNGIANSLGFSCTNNSMSTYKDNDCYKYANLGDYVPIQYSFQGAAFGQSYSYEHYRVTENQGYCHYDSGWVDYFPGLSHCDLGYGNKYLTYQMYLSDVAGNTSGVFSIHITYYD